MTRIASHEMLVFMRCAMMSIVEPAKACRMAAWMRASLAWSSIGATFERWRRATVLCSLAALALDVTLALVALPCSDHRADDVRMAQNGAFAQGVALAAFVWATRRRAGVTDVDPHAQPPTN